MTVGKLYIVATPIGNLADITFRAVTVLQTVDLIAAEDTRHSRVLLNHYHIATPLLSLHQYNEQERTQRLLSMLQAGKNIALISDAGTPLISDPGYQLVHAAHLAHITVIPIPGACAAISALVASGLPCEQFVFVGFLPVKTSARQRYLQPLVMETRTIIFYEAPHRIENLLSELIAVFGPERLATIARELTKTFETIHQDTLTQLQDRLVREPQQRKGEFVVVLQGVKNIEQSTEETELARVLTILLEELPLKQAAALAATLLNKNRQQAYRVALKLRG